MKRMLPLRILAIGSNVFFLAYGFSLHVWPSILLNLALLPVNLRRVYEIRKLTSEITRATVNSPVSQWLLPHMRRRTLNSGDILFRKGDPADRLIYLSSGELELAEIGKTIARGELIGEIGLFTPDRKRTQTAVCRTDCELYEMTDEMLFQVYYQQPAIGFYLVRLIAARLLSDIDRERAALQSA
jgi:CRP-like cAMP-binding protein